MSVAPVQVVAGVLFHPTQPDWQFLGRRRLGLPFAGTWEHPGGKVNPGETHQQALAREWYEEVGIAVEVSPLPVGFYADPYGSVYVSLYVVKLVDPESCWTWFEDPHNNVPVVGTAHDCFMFASPYMILQIPRADRVPSLKTLAHAADLLT